MVEPQQFMELARRLSTCDYDVQPDGEGYIVRHRHNAADMSHARHLDDLADLAELIEWAARRYQQNKGGGGQGRSNPGHILC